MDVGIAERGDCTEEHRFTVHHDIGFVMLFQGEG